MAAGKNPKMIYPKIYSALTDGAQVSLKDSVEMVEQNLSAKKSPFTLFFLDEIDQLAVAGDEQNVLYRIFEWPHIKKFKCALIGVANSMDMVEKILPRLKSKNCISSTLLK
jgi:cell division control protein 6